MARIETYERSVGLQPTNTPVAALSSAVADELVGFGGAVQNVAAEIIRKNEEKENFRAENGYRKLNLELQADLEARAQNINEGGAGFHDGYMAEVFEPKRTAFLETVPERLRPKFQTLLDPKEGADAANWSINAATVERDEGYRWQKSELTDAQNEMASAIGLDPDNYDAFKAAGDELIAASSLPTPEKDKLRDEWGQMSQVAVLNAMLETNPEGVLRDLGGDPRKLSPTTQFSILSRAVQWQESRDNPNAVSGKGAVGLMQVMPGTAADIAEQVGDASFPKGAPESVVRAYLSNPAVNKRYGEFYLQQQLRAFANTRNPIETALVAYNAGPGVAQKWVESGYNDKMLSKETRNYKREIMSTLVAPAARGHAKDVVWEGVKTEGTNPDLVGRVADAYATLGLKKVRVNSAGRSPEANAQVGGADKSQHLDNNALDLNVSGMTIPQKIELIKSLSAAGVTGIGVYGNAIHADLGGRRAWGPDHSSGSVPKWASGIIAEHLNGTAPPPRAVDSRFASLPYDKAQQFISKADQNITAAQTAAAKSGAVEKVEVKRDMANEIAMVRATGQGSGNFDETNVSTILGEDDYMTFIAKRDIAQRSFNATQGVATMNPEDMEQHYKMFDPVPGSDDFAAQQEVQEAVRRETDRVRNLRANSPDQAALAYPDVQEAYKGIEQLDAAGSAVPPNQVQGFVRLMLEKQADFGVAPAARAPVPQAWAIEIGRALTRVPELSGKNMSDVRSNLVVQYEALRSVYGDYTDEVVLYALSEYTGMSKEQAKFISALVPAIQNGTGPFRPKTSDTVQDQGQVDVFNSVGPALRSIPGFGPALGGLFGGGTPATEEGLSPEEQLRGLDSEEE